MKTPDICDPVTPDDRKLAADLHAQRGGDLTSITLGVCYGRRRVEQGWAEEVAGYRRDRNQAVDRVEKQDAEVTRLKGQLEAAEQHVKILQATVEDVTKARDRAREQVQAMVACVREALERLA